ncbi:MAG: TIGR03757 family integrating conjugative element protein [Chromatiaceae bacterium]|nr:TIGR03757 family integrating conjugative element protein [Chromatiaceae bacterium]
MLNPSKPFRILALATAIALVIMNGVVSADGKPLVEVFTTSDIPIISDHQGDRVQVYEIDGIKLLEEKISHGLSGNTNTAKQQAIERVTQLEEEQKQQVQRTAIGLSKAQQYGIDRYPAIVFNSEAVVYGVTDLAEAMHRYREWQESTTQ